MEDLPAPILHHVLSFLDDDDKEAARTCVLSKSWRHLWCTRPEFSLSESSFIKEKEKFIDEELSFTKDKEKFIDVLERSFQVYYDRKLCIDDFRVWMYMVDPALVLLLEKWIPIVAMKKLHLSFKYRDTLPYAVFESESLQKLFLENCNLRQIQINSVVGNNLKTLHLKDVCVEEEETFVKFLSNCSLIEDLSLRFCKGLRTITMLNHHNLKSFEVQRIDDGSNIEIYLPSSTIGRIIIRRCPNWYHHRNYFPGLTRLELICVPLSREWFNSFSRNFPCLEDLLLYGCNGFGEFELSSRSIKKLGISMDESTTKATIDAPSIKKFSFSANISQSISFSATTSSEWNSEIHLFLDASQWFLKLSEVVAAISQSHINSLRLNHYSDIEHPWDISIYCGGGSYKPVAIKSLYLNMRGVYCDFFISDLVIGLFCFVRPREIIQFGKDEFLCRTLQMGRWEEEEEEEEEEDEDEGMRSVFFWQHDLEQVSLQVRNGPDEELRPVQGTVNWSEYVKKERYSELHFGLKWRE